MSYKKAIDHYIGRECRVGIDCVLENRSCGYSNGGGYCKLETCIVNPDWYANCIDETYIREWNVEGIEKPTKEQILSIMDNICNVEVLRAEKLIENQTNYLSIRNGVKVVNGVPINIDPTSITNIIGQELLVTINKAKDRTPLTITWFDDVNVANEYTEDEFEALSNTIAVTIFLIQQKLSTNKIAIANATTIEELNAIDTNYSNL